ncbi:MAG TPA: hypothetical protein VLL08_03885 [Kineosporiaceae bacterium]|nr:hypothetical protein [Kineosporiaceae bacterium]
MPEADEGDGPRFPIEPHRDALRGPSTELGGPIQEQALPDHGRLVIKREGVFLEGSMPALVMGLSVAGTVGCVFIAAQADGLLLGLAGMASILAQNAVFFRSGLRRPRIIRGRKPRVSRKAQR